MDAGVVCCRAVLWRYRYAILLVAFALISIGVAVLSDLVSSRDTSWCISCSNSTTTGESCTSYDLWDATSAYNLQLNDSTSLVVSANSSYRPPIRVNSDDGLDASAVCACLSLTNGFVSLWMLTAFLAIAYVVVLWIMRRRLARDDRRCFSIAIAAVILTAWATCVIGILVLSAVAVAFWRQVHDPAGFCSGICSGFASPNQVSRSADSSDSAAVSSSWVGSGYPTVIGPYALNAMLAMSILNGETRGVLALSPSHFTVHCFCAAVCNVVLGTCLVRDGHLREFCCGRVALPCADAPNAPWRADGASIGTRIALISRALPVSELNAALRTSGCPPALADFVSARAQPCADPFTCTICREDCAVGVMSVDLECGGTMSVRVTVAQATGGSECLVGTGVDSLAQLPARHRFCPPCIAASLYMRPACPLCMRTVAIRVGLSGRRVHPLPAAQATVERHPPHVAIGAASVGGDAVIS